MHLANRILQVWHMRERRMVVIAAENALTDEEAGIIITMSTHFVRVPGLEMCSNCRERENEELDWAEIGRTHMKVLVNPRGLETDVKELRPFPVWGSDATTTHTWLEGFVARRSLPPRPIHDGLTPNWCRKVTQFTQYVVRQTTIWSTAQNRHRLVSSGRVIRLSHISKLAQGSAGTQPFSRNNESCCA